MSLRSRLYLASAVMIAALFGPAYYALGQLGELRDIAFDLRSRHAAAFVSVGQLQTSVSELNRLQRSYVAAPDAEVRRELREQSSQVTEQSERLRRSDYSSDARSVTARLDSVVVAAGQIDQLVRDGRIDQATTALQGVKPLYDRANEGLRALAETIDARSTADAVRAQRISATAARTSAIALFVALAVALAIGVVSIGAVTSPLRRLRSAMAAVAGGEFDPPDRLPYARTDEVGDLSRSFRAMTERLAELDRLKAEFVSIASHELKTPVSVIHGYAEMLEEGFYGGVSDKQAEVLGYIKEQTAVLVERVNQLLSLSRIEARGMEVELQDVPLRELLAELSRTFQPLAVQKEIDFQVEAEASAPAVFRGDRGRLSGELLGNLISNAFKFTPAGGRVRVRARGADGASGGRVMFEVSDSGEGIPPSQLPYIFEKYYQAGHSAGKVGTGLGLAIAREVVEAHRGRIEAESEPGRGTTFRVELPTRPVPVRAPRPPEGGPGTADGRRPDSGSSSPAAASAARS